jgi:class 3 adenylate cyclase
VPHPTTAWVYDFKFDTHTIWPLISDTDRGNQIMGMPPVRYELKPRSLGGTLLWGRFRLQGMEFAWKEHPYEWMKGDFLSVEREYTRGPFKWMRVHWRFEDQERGCRLTQTIEFEPRHAWTKSLLARRLRRGTAARFQKFYRKIEAELTTRAQAESPLAPQKQEKVKHDKMLLKRIEERFDEGAFDAITRERLRTLIFDSPANALARIQPFSMARDWGMPPYEALSIFLRATKVGIFDLSWDLVCPSCQGAKARVSNLANLVGEAHCDQCDIRFDAQFDRSVELSFISNPAIRQSESIQFCAGSPRRTEHYLAQFRLAPGSEREFRVTLTAGTRYRLRSRQTAQRYAFEVREAEAGAPSLGLAPAAIDLQFAPRDETVSELALAPGVVSFRLKNELADEIVVHLEKDDSSALTCTAAYVTSHQEFRDLFSSEVLSRGQEIRISSLALLFTDLKDSTALYQHIGEAKAFALVNEHLRILTEQVRTNQGAVVKTIGDAVMAVFRRPEDALRAALGIQQVVADGPVIPVFEDRLRVKVGIHCGPCYVVNRNDRLDYFGSTVNIAARTQAEAGSDEILLTGRMMGDPAVRKTLLSEHRVTEQVVRTVKGISQEMELYRIGPLSTG